MGTKKKCDDKDHDKDKDCRDKRDKCRDDDDHDDDKDRDDDKKRDCKKRDDDDDCKYREHYKYREYWKYRECDDDDDHDKKDRHDKKCRRKDDKDRDDKKDRGLLHTSHQIREMEKTAKSLTDSLADLGRGAQLHDLLRIVSQPGSTSPAEVAFVNAILDHLSVEVRALERLQADLVEASRKIVKDLD